MRLQKFMAEAGVASRRKCEELIAGGMVRVNGHIAVLGENVSPDTDVVEYNAKVLKQAEQRVFILFNKPRSVICTSNDPEGRETIFDYFKGFKYRLFSVGRLDYDSEGLLIMTNDGELANMLSHPRYELEKEYEAICEGTLSAEQLKRLETGVMLCDGVTAPAKVSDVHVIKKTGNTSLHISIHEGRNRQIRRMLDAIGHETVMLRRVRIGPLRIQNDLPAGSWRYMTEEEIRALRRMLK